MKLVPPVPAEFQKPSLWGFCEPLRTNSNELLGGTSNLLVNTITFPSISAGVGIKVNHSSPSFCYRDLEFVEFPDPAGTDAPQIVAFRGGVRGHFYQTTPQKDKMDLRAHLNHDIVPGSDAFIHIHWSHDATSISGNIEFLFESTYAKGHNQAIFPATKTITLTYNTVNITTTPRWQHMITELRWATAGGSATEFDSNTFEIDGLILATATINTLPTLAGGTTVAGQPGVWIHRIDMHYLSTGIGSKNKSPNFYL